MDDTVRAAVMTAPGVPLEIRAFAKPKLDRGAALLETLYSEVCGTDVHLWHGRLAGVPYPIIPGHVSVGRIAEMHGEIRDVNGVPFREGEVVAFMDVHESCGACHFCLVAKETTRCPHRKVYGITYSAEEGLLGGWSERIWMKPGVKLIHFPEGLKAEEYIGGGCGLNTAFHAVERAGVRLDDFVVVLGAGPVGQSIVAFAALSGAAQVVVIGAPDDRLEMARRMGATAAMSIVAAPHPERLEELRAMTHGRGADVVIEATGAPQAVVEGAELCRDGGTLLVCGQYTDCGPASWNVHELLNKKHLDVRGCWGSDFSHFYKSIHTMARHRERIPWGDVVTRHYPLDQVNEALQAVEKQEVLKAAIVPNA